VVLAIMLVGVLTKPGTINPRLQMWVARLALIGIIVSAVFAFN
jgi:hypothetical protein